MSAYVLKMYITGRTARSERAIAELTELCRKDLGGKYRVEVIDVLQQPQLAEQDKILATPTVVKELPPPMRRVVGDLSKTEQVLLGLDLTSERGNNVDANG